MAEDNFAQTLLQGIGRMGPASPLHAYIKGELEPGTPEFEAGRQAFESLGSEFMGEDSVGAESSSPRPETLPPAPSGPPPPPAPLMGHPDAPPTDAEYIKGTPSRMEGRTAKVEANAPPMVGGAWQTESEAIGDSAGVTTPQVSVSPKKMVPPFEGGLAEMPEPPKKKGKGPLPYVKKESADWWKAGGGPEPPGEAPIKEAPPTVEKKEFGLQDFLPPELYSTLMESATGKPGWEDAFALGMLAIADPVMARQVMASKDADKRTALNALSQASVQLGVYKRMTDQQQQMTDRTMAQQEAIANRQMQTENERYQRALAQERMDTHREWVKAGTNLGVAVPALKNPLDDQEWFSINEQIQPLFAAEQQKRQKLVNDQRSAMTEFYNTRSSQILDLMAKFDTALRGQELSAARGILEQAQIQYNTNVRKLTEMEFQATRADAMDELGPTLKRLRDLVDDNAREILDAKNRYTQALRENPERDPALAWDMSLQRTLQNFVSALGGGNERQTPEDVLSQIVPHVMQYPEDSLSQQFWDQVYGAYLGIGVPPPLRQEREDYLRKLELEGELPPMNMPLPIGQPQQENAGASSESEPTGTE